MGLFLQNKRQHKTDARIMTETVGDDLFDGVCGEVRETMKRCKTSVADDDTQGARSQARASRVKL